MIDLNSLPNAELAALADRAQAELARRYALFPEAAPVDPAEFNPTEKLADGHLRWVTAKEAAYQTRCSVDAIERAVKAGKVGLKIGGRLWVDRVRLRGR